MNLYEKYLDFKIRLQLVFLV